MKDNELDTNIKKALMEGTNEALEMKAKVWENIQKGIKEEKALSEESENNKNRGVVQMESRVKKNKSNWIKLTTVAAAASMLFLFGTEPGQAAINKIKEILVPEKQIVEELEGQKEDTNVTLEERASYAIYFDKERYEMVTVEGKDRIVPLGLPETMPEVYMEIEQITDQKPRELFAKIEQELKSEFSKVENLGQVETPLLSLSVRAIDGGQKWDDTVVEYFIVDNGKGGSFVIKQVTFLEAEEGHGVRFDNMLKEFRITDE